MRDSGLEVEEIDYGKTGLSEDTVKALVAAAGSVAAVLNTRHEIAKAKGWAARPPSPAEFAAAATKDVNLLRRPILIDGKKVHIGFDKDVYAKLRAK